VSDATVFQKAIAEERIVLTINCIDFVELALDYQSRSLQFPGVFLVYKHNDIGRDMSYDRIVQAIANLEQTKIAIKTSCHTLNLYDYPAPGIQAGN
jgi:hypothetical protein